MDKIIFEDNSKTDISILLKMACDCVSFSNSSHKIIDKLKEYPASDIIVVFLDIVPDNDKCVSSYTEIRNYCIYNNRDSIFLIPIPCIEYYLIQSLKSLICCDEHFLNYVVDYSPEYHTITGLPDKVNTFERYCKYLYKTYRHSCLTSGKQKFFIGECKCEKCPDFHNMYGKSLVDKSIMIWRYIPVVPEMEHDLFSTIRKNLSQVKEEMIYLYNDAAKRFYDYGISVGALDLNEV